MVVGDGEGALTAQADVVSCEVFKFGREPTEPGHGQQVDAEQRILAEQALGAGREHPGGHAGRGVAMIGVDQDDAEPGGRRPPRRHRWSRPWGAPFAGITRIRYNGRRRRGLPLSPPGLPWSELFPLVHPISWRAR